MNFIVIDCETDFAHTRVDMTGIYSTNGDDCVITDTRQLELYFKDKDPASTTIVTWNGTRFDLPMLSKCWDVDLSRYKHIDGMLLSKLLFHGRKGGHSLANVAKSTFDDPKYHKSDIDFGEASEEETAKYCSQDCFVTWHVVKEMLLSEQYKRNKDACRTALSLEQKVAALVNEQVEKRVYFNVEKATNTHKRITARMNEVEQILADHLPVRPLPESKIHYPPKVQFKMDGSLSANMLRYARKYGADLKRLEGSWQVAYPDGRCYTLPVTAPAITSYKLTLSNQTELKNWLQEEGWLPTDWNYKFEDGKKVVTSPRLTDKVSKEPCPGLNKMGWTHAPLVSEWLMLRSRKNILKSDKGTGWIPQAEASPDNSIPSDGDSMGANTGRWTHKGIANVPRPSSPWGKEIRECFSARPGKVWVGWDASSLEACVEAHYTHKADPKYAMSLIEGDSDLGTDVHTRNQKLLDLPSRNVAKTFKYAITYGAQPPTLRKTLGGTLEESEKVYNNFWATNPALAKLKKNLTLEWKLNGKRYIKGLDGRPIWCRSEHSLINALFQSAGAIIMKYAMILADHNTKDFYKSVENKPYGLIRYHDEEIWECADEAQAMTLGTFGIRSIKTAGKHLRLNVPLNAKALVGNNWAEVH